MRIEKSLHDRLAKAAIRHDRSKNSMIRESILRYLDDIDDAVVADERLEDPKAVAVPFEEIRREGMDYERMMEAGVRGLERINALMRHGDRDPLSLNDVVILLDHSDMFVNVMRRERLILGVPLTPCEYVFPAWQFDMNRRRIVSGICEVMSILDTSDVWSAVIFFASPNINTEGIPPIDVLKRNDSGEYLGGAAWGKVMRAAGLWLNHGAS